MSLSTTLSIAQQSLSNNAALSTIVSRNIAGVNNPNYSTKTGNVETTLDGGARIASITNATDNALFSNLLTANAQASAASALSGGLGQIEQTLGLSSTTNADGTSSDTSPATLIGNLTNALQQYAASPSNTTLGTAAVTAAKALASNLKAASTTVQSVRGQADQGLAKAVSTINSLLQQFGTANAAVMSASVSGADATDAIDSRNAILQSLSAQIGITTASTGNGGLAIYTDGGATLFQNSARTVSFTPQTTFQADTIGNAVMVDGVAVTGSGPMASKTGAIAGLTQLRDSSSVDYQNQLDQIAQGLVKAFSGNTASDGTGTAVPGLFTNGTSADMPTSVVGLAATIQVAAGADPTAVTSAPGTTPVTYGSVTALRDGGLNGAYNGNSSPVQASYATNLNALLTSLNANQGFDSASGGAASATLAGYASSSVSWLENARQAASTDSTNKTAVVTQTTTSLSSATGVNLDEQLSKMLDLEHSYQASAELMTTVKSMLDALLAAVN